MSFSLNFQVSFFSTSPELSNKQRFEYFSRTIPSDHYQVKAMVDIVRRMGWSYISIIYEESNYGIKVLRCLSILYLFEQWYYWTKAVFFCNEVNAKKCFVSLRISENLALIFHCNNVKAFIFRHLQILLSDVKGKQMYCILDF